jgi:hypothetical protein
MIRRCAASFLIFACVSQARIPIAAAQTPTTQPKAQISLALVTEEGKQLIRAIVVANGKPVENATVSFGVRRTFGTLVLGEDKTLDDGSAAVSFPKDLPGGPKGQLQVVAEIKSPATFASIRTEATFDGARRLDVNADSLPRALWAPRAPYALIIPIVLLLAGVWATYAFVFVQVLAIRKGAKS